ncbi:MAG: chorismate synthase, partial [Flavobacteriales bacterium]|nr:chorismate synthase [Flavobacteriales bacterium]
GMPITAIVHFKPVATLQMPQETITSEGIPATLPPKGRHDACVIPRAVPIVEAVMLIHLADACLAARLSKWS